MSPYSTNRLGAPSPAPSLVGHIRAAEIVTMNQRTLEDLYRATEEDLLCGIGLLVLPDQEPAPFIHIHYRTWPREQLEIVRESFRAALVLTFSRRAEDTRDLHLSARERIGIQAMNGDHRSVLRAPVNSESRVSISAFETASTQRRSA